MQRLIKETAEIARIREKKSALVINKAHPFEKNSEKISPCREIAGMVIGVALYHDFELAAAALEEAHDKIDFIFFDMDWDDFAELSKKIPLLKSDKVFTYSDGDVWSESTFLMAKEKLFDFNKNILLVGDGGLAAGIAHRISNAQIAFAWAKNEATTSATYDMVIAAEIGKEVLTDRFQQNIGPNTILLDAGIGSISKKLIDWALANGREVLRIDNKAGLTGKIFSLIETREQMRKRMGREKVAGFQVVAGGAMGHPGDIVVDNIKDPVQVLGIADGSGKFRNISETDEHRIKQFKTLLMTPLERG